MVSVPSHSPSPGLLDNPNAVEACGDRTTRADCNLNGPLPGKALPWWTCAWRTAREGKVVDEFYIFGLKTIDVVDYAYSLPLADESCAVEVAALINPDPFPYRNTVVLPPEYGFHAVSYLTSGSTVGEGSMCSLFWGTESFVSSTRNCTTRLSDFNGPGVTLGFRISPSVNDASNSWLPLRVTTTYYRNCDSSRRAARRLADDRDRDAWTRHQTVPQVVLGGPDYTYVANDGKNTILSFFLSFMACAHSPLTFTSSSDLKFESAAKGIVFGLLTGSKAARTTVSISSHKTYSRSGDDTRDQRIYAYLISEADLTDYLNSDACITSCPAPLNMALDKCSTRRDRSCDFSVDRLDPNERYVVAVSKSTLGLNIDAPAVIVRYNVDARYAVRPRK